VRRVGGRGWLNVNVRVLAATRRDLDQAVQAGKFRDDLFFRLAVARIELPPLRNRRDDIGILTHHFWSKLGGQGAPPAEMLESFAMQAWPGNVRELYNAVARRIALGDLAAAPPGPQTQRGGGPDSSRARLDGTTDAALDLAAHVLSLDLPLTRARDRLVEEFERRYVERVLARHGGNVRSAAAASGIARRYFQILRARHGHET
jgi:DNA-binding NtrC family response regulator